MCSENHNCPLTPPALGILAGSPTHSCSTSWDQPTCVCQTPISATTPSLWLP